MPGSPRLSSASVDFSRCLGHGGNSQRVAGGAAAGLCYDDCAALPAAVANYMRTVLFHCRVHVACRQCMHATIKYPSKREIAAYSVGWIEMFIEVLMAHKSAKRVLLIQSDVSRLSCKHQKACSTISARFLAERARFDLDMSSTNALSYKVIRKIGQGSYGTVYWCRSKKDPNINAAVKVVARLHLKSGRRQQRLVQEFIDVEWDSDFVYIFMELCELGNLKNWLKSRPVEEKVARWF
ncbi:hypothetical protein BC832DRAFT_541053 [Gaertneriomyces semiglobifer]|nr:hypothetical protein BC832DRAFT_541053 [Gaertneriomyces semiglobifer]